MDNAEGFIDTVDGIAANALPLSGRGGGVLEALVVLLARRRLMKNVFV
jgi:hypothetical protein